MAVLMKQAEKASGTATAMTDAILRWKPSCPTLDAAALTFSMKTRTEDVEPSDSAPLDR